MVGGFKMNQVLWDALRCYEVDEKVFRTNKRVSFFNFKWISVYEHLVKILENNLNEKDEFGKTPLYYACYAGYTRLVAEILKHVTFSKENPIDSHMLYHALQYHDNTEVFDMLLEAKADINLPKDSNDEPLLWQCIDIGRKKWFAYAIKKGFDINASAENGENFFSYVVRECKPNRILEHLKRLVDNGFDLNLKCDANYQPLMAATKIGYWETFIWLVDNGAMPQYCDEVNFEPILRGYRKAIYRSKSQEENSRYIQLHNDLIALLKEKKSVASDYENLEFFC